MSLYGEFKRRNVFRVAIAYLAAAWLLSVVATLLFPLFGFGEAPVRIVVILLAIGFPLFLIFSWVFETPPEGLMLEKEIEVNGPYGWHEIPNHPLLQNLHGDPRWQALLTRVGVSAKQLASIEFKVNLPISEKDLITRATNYE